MSFAIQIIAGAAGEPSEHAGEFVVEYEPASMGQDGQYRPDGTLRTTRNILNARTFESGGEAMHYYRQSNGRRPDGMPNRPLTHYTVLIATLEELIG